MNGIQRRRYVVNARNFSLVLGQRTLIMGIVNATPDSFSQDGCWKGNEDQRHAQILRMCRKQIREGADILDIGGESTRPGAARISNEEEIRRVVPVIEQLSRKCSVPISVDTYKPRVAKSALQAGASIVNCIQGTPVPRALLKVVKEFDAAIVLMHILGTPRTMQKNIVYRQDVVREICSALQVSIEQCLSAGISGSKIIVDPGIGFGKTVEHNLEIIARLSELRVLRCPVLLGTSRKSFIGKTLNRDIGDRLPGTLASICAGIMGGAHIVRVHDVRPAYDAARLTDAIVNSKDGSVRSSEREGI